MQYICRSCLLPIAYSGIAYAIYTTVEGVTQDHSTQYHSLCMCARRHVAALLYNSIQTFKDQLSLLKNNGRVSCWPKKKTRRTLLVWEEAGMAPGPRSRTNRLANCRLPLLSFVSHSELGLFFLLQCCLDYNKKLWSFWFNCTLITIGTTFLPISPVCKSEILWLAPLVFAQLLGPKGPTWRRRFDNNCWKQTARDRTVERHM